MTLISSVVSEIVGGGQNGPPLAVRVTKISVAVRVLRLQRVGSIYQSVSAHSVYTVI